MKATTNLKFSRRAWSAPKRECSLSAFATTLDEGGVEVEIVLSHEFEEIRRTSRNRWIRETFDIKLTEKDALELAELLVDYVANGRKRQGGGK